MSEQRQIKHVAVLLNPHIPFGTPFRYERKEEKLGICASHKNQSRYRFYSFHNTIMMRLGIAKHACHEEVRFHTLAQYVPTNSQGGGFLKKVQQCLDCQAISSPSMRFVLVLASDDQQDGPKSRIFWRTPRSNQTRQRQMLLLGEGEALAAGSQRINRDVQELVQEDNFCSKSPLRAQETAAGDKGICSAGSRNENGGEEDLC